MKQEISMLIDGELCDEDAEALLNMMKRDPGAHQEWVDFHLIGDVMRQPGYIPGNMNDTFFQRLQAEPIILAPRSRKVEKLNSYAMTAVASVMAFALLAWLSVQMNIKSPQVQLAKQRFHTLAVVKNPISEGMNAYLLAHQEYSPSTDVRGASSYIHNVAFANPSLEQEP